VQRPSRSMGRTWGDRLPRGPADRRARGSSDRARGSSDRARPSSGRLADVSGPTEPAALPEPPPVAAAEPRQRWRLVVARSTDAPKAGQREVADAWTAALVAAGLPLAGAEGGRSRARLSFGAPLPIGMAAERELIDVVLVERWPLWRVRDALDAHLPAGWRLVDLFDVWLSGQPLAGQVVAADYRIELETSCDPAMLERAAAQMLAADRLPRDRQKGDRTVAYDLRPLLIDVTVEPEPPPTVRTRTRFHPELGTGRPEEVLAALADRAGTALTARSIVRERVVLAEDAP
jgi:radical SAM-linked protein